MAFIFPTPPESQSDGEQQDFNDQRMLVSMSTTFYPRDDHPTDLIIISVDGVFFSVHRRRLLQQSQNAFGNHLFLDDCQSFTVPESSEVINLVLHAFYDFDAVNYKPTLDQIAGMLDALPKYGLPLEIPIATGNPTYNLILGVAFSAPLDTFSLVCQHRLERLAVEISHFLISVPLHHLTDEQCLAMGPIYLRRLVFLHLGRTERLKALLQEPPKGHIPSASCDAIDQKRKLELVWKEAICNLCWKACANTSVSLFHTELSPIVDKLSCADCKTAAKERIRKLIVDWTLVKTTI